MEERKENEGPSDNEGKKQHEPKRRSEPQRYEYPSRRPPRRKKSQKPTIAGALLLVVAILGMLFSLIMVGSGFILDDIGDWPFSDGGTTTIEGEVYDQYGDPIEDATITVIDTDLETTTDADGKYRLAGVPNGFQEIRVESSGYETIIYKTHIHSDSSTKEDYNVLDVEIHRRGNQIDFQMDEGTGENTIGFDREMLETIFGDLHGFLTFLGIVTLVCSIVALIGGIYAIKRDHYGVTIAAAVVGIFSFGFAIGSVLSIIALFVLILASNEFEPEEDEYYRRR